MQRYVLLSLKNGQLAGAAPILAPNDVDAIESAWTRADDASCELWAGERLVAFIERSA